MLVPLRSAMRRVRCRKGWATPITPVRADPAKAGRGSLRQPFFDCLLTRQGRMPPVRPGPLYEIALVVKAVAEYVGPVRLIPVPDRCIVQPLTQPARWD